MKERGFNAERIGMRSCLHCSGYGRKYRVICSRCGGFGYIKKDGNKFRLSSLMPEDRPAHPHNRRRRQISDQGQSVLFE
jgi:hypothetical protein